MTGRPEKKGSSRARSATTVARLAPAESPPTMRALWTDMPSDVAFSTVWRQMRWGEVSSRAGMRVQRWRKGIGERTHFRAAKESFSPVGKGCSGASLSMQFEETDMSVMQGTGQRGTHWYLYSTLRTAIPSSTDSPRRKASSWSRSPTTHAAICMA